MFAGVHGFEGGAWWRGQDSNLRKVTLTELQSVAFDHSATPPRDTPQRLDLQSEGGLGEAP